MQRLKASSGHQSIQKSEPDRDSGEKPQGTWKAFLGFAVGIVVVLFAVIAGTEPPTSSLARR